MIHMGDTQPLTDHAQQVPVELIKHLEMIQAVVARLAGNSFLIKGWALTVSATLYGFAVDRAAWGLAAMGVLVSGIFWYLDSFYLRGERMHRRLYDDARLADGAIPPFSLDTRRYHGQVSRLGTFLSVTLVTFYVMPIAIGVVVIAVESTA
jgi:hypothetical protein